MRALCEGKSLLQRRRRRKEQGREEAHTPHTREREREEEEEERKKGLPFVSTDSIESSFWEEVADDRVQAPGSQFSKLVP